MKTQSKLNIIEVHLKWVGFQVLMENDFLNGTRSGIKRMGAKNQGEVFWNLKF